VRASRDAAGKWQTSFVVEAPTFDASPARGTIGIDWGVITTATTTDSEYDLPHFEHGKRAQAKLSHYQRMMARRRRPKGQSSSNGYRQAKSQVANIYGLVKRQRQDDARKWAKKIMLDHDQIAVEDFKPKFLAKTKMARKAADGAIGQAKKDLIWMSVKYQRDLRLIDPAYTTMDCGECGARAKCRLSLSERAYSCSECGHTCPRDKNSAAVMVARAGFAPAGVDRLGLEVPLGALSSVSQESPGFSRGEDSRDLVGVGWGCCWPELGRRPLSLAR
jgi:putative transposase